MIPLEIKLDGDAAFVDLQDDFATGNAQGGVAFRVASLPGGMQSGALSIAIGVRGNDGKVIVAETSWRLLYAAMVAIEARYGRPT